jgi:hypothetical protein
MTPDEPSASIAAGESSSAATGYEGTEDGLLGYHPVLMGFRGDLSINLAEAPKIPNKDAQDYLI